MIDVDQLWAYCGQRALDRRSTTGVTRHALTWSAVMSGAMDAVCGVIARVAVGDWSPELAHACPECAALLASDAEPEQLELFAA